MAEKSECIAAIATARGPAGISVVRISGDDAWEVASRVIGDVKKLVPTANSFFHVKFVSPQHGGVVDDGVALFFEAPRSYTGENVVELQGHGGRVPSGRLLSAVLSAGARLAEPGEFTKRAFLNGKLDLTQAEAVMELIEARTERAAASARAQLDGELGGVVNSICDELLDVQSDVEHLLDFDENEVPPEFFATAQSRLALLCGKIGSLLTSCHTGRLLREGALVVISGRPNAGKSSLLNALLGENRAIVSPSPGTTRDSIEESFSVQGIPVRLVDTAGIREGAVDSIEAEGISRAEKLLTEADLNLRIVDSTEALSEEDIREIRRFDPSRLLVVANKIDLPACVQPGFPFPAGYRVVRISAKSGEGIACLLSALADALDADSCAADGAVVAERHRVNLTQTLAALDEAALCLARNAEGLVFAAQHMWMAALCLSEITGRVWSERLLDAVFSKFCVGK